MSVSNSQRAMLAAAVIVAALLSPVRAQDERALPVVTAGAMPLYPRTPLVAGFQGRVSIRVTTDARHVAALETMSGPPLLAAAATENIRTWEFDPHVPATFVTTFEYAIETPMICGVGNSASVLNLPLEVHVSAKSVGTCDPSGVRTPRR